MASKKVAVDFFYDVISAYSYVAFEQLTRYQQIWPTMSMRLKPFSMPHILRGSGNKPPFDVPNKVIYMARDLNILSQYYQVPFKVPSNFTEVREKGTFKAMRFLTSVDLITDGKATEALSRQFWRRVFESHEDVSEVDSIKATAKSSNLKKDVIEAAIIGMEKPETKARLQKYTEEALSYGAFGAPTIVAHLSTGPEMLFGGDRIEILANLLGEKYKGSLAKPSKTRILFNRKID